MKEYLTGYYCRDDLHLRIVNKESNRKILDALKDSYPNGLDVYQLEEMTNLPLKTIYAQKTELYREYYISHSHSIEDTKSGPRRETPLKRPSPKRGRPKREALERPRIKYVIEETSGVHDVYDGKKPIPLPPGNVLYAEGFVDAWHKLVEKEEEEKLCIDLLRFLQKMFARVRDHDDKMVRKWAPERDVQYWCSQCGLNHEARDFIRAVLLHLIDQLEKNDTVLNYLKDNALLKPESFERITGKKT